MGNPKKDDEIKQKNTAKKRRVVTASVANEASLPKQRKCETGKANSKNSKGTGEQINKNKFISEQLNVRVTRSTKDKARGKAKNNNASPCHSYIVDDLEKDQVQHDGVDLSVNSEDEREYGELNESERHSEEESESEDETACDGEEDVSSEDDEVVLGGLASSEQEFKRMMKDKKFKKYFNELVDERIQEIKSNTEEDDVVQSPKKGTLKRGSKGNSQGKSTPQKGKTVLRANVNAIKSPSDTTLYKPVLQLQREVNNVIDHETVQNNMMNRISDFVESLRLEGDHSRGSAATASRVVVPGREEAQAKADRAILEAEKFEAVINEPEGMSHLAHSIHLQDNVNDSGEGQGQERQPFGVNTHQGENERISTGLSDDDFFHLTCFIEPSLISKIEKGEFVELEKLLPKPRNKRRGNDNLMQWVHRDGETFLAPAGDGDRAISGIRRWEQAFRVYSTIYCSVKPHRAKEIWQYISIINTAASSFVWDNVYEYDVLFRHLMAFNPNRSWSVTYTQMWNVCMREHLPPRFVTGRSNNGSGYGTANHFCQASINYGPSTSSAPSTSSSSVSGSQGSKKRKSSDYCWSFNRGVRCKFGDRCRYIERCSYCDKPSHGKVSCPQLSKSGGSSSTPKKPY